MPDEGLLAGERLDDLGIRGWRIIQHPDAFRFSLDAVLLAHFAQITRTCRAADLGTGTGAVALLLLSRGVTAVDALDNHPFLLDMAVRTMRLNSVGDRIRVVQGDVNQVVDSLHPGDYDLVTANPPFRTPGTGRVSLSEGLARARHEMKGTLEAFVAAAATLLRYHGRFAMVHLPERLVDIVGAMRAMKVEPKRLRMVHSFSGTPPRMLLVEGVKQGKPGLSVLPPLVVYESPGRYSSEILAYYQQERG